MGICNYFDTLADDELSICMRYMSSKPNSYWYKHLRDANRDLVFAKDGPFAAVIGREMTKLAVNRDPEDEGTITISAKNHTGARIIRNWGNHAVEAHIGDNICRPLSALSLITATRTYCTSIRRLSLIFDIERVPLMNSLIEANAAQLESLSLSSCSYLSRPLSFPTLPNLSTLHIQAVGLHDYSNVVRSSFRTLECVTLKGTQTDWMSLISDLYGCKKLRVVELNGAVPGEEYASLLESFGSQIERAVMDEMDENLCARVVTSCPNMVCNLSVNANDLNKITVLGSRVRRLTLKYLENSNRINGMEAASAQCPHITAMNCDSNGEGDGGLLVQMFASEKRHLQSVKFLWTNATLSNELIQYITSSTGNLRNLNLNVTRFEDYSSLMQLLRVNPFLETVDIAEMGQVNADSGVEKAVVTLRALKQHRNLRRLSIFFPMFIPQHGLALIATECLPYRHRRINVDVSSNNLC